MRARAPTDQPGRARPGFFALSSAAVSAPRKSSTVRPPAGGVSRRARSSAAGTVGFIGLGAMGAPMAMRLVEAGLVVRVYNRSRGPERVLEKLGARSCATPGECARGAEI